MVSICGAKITTSIPDIKSRCDPNAAAAAFKGNLSSLANLLSDLAKIPDVPPPAHKTKTLSAC